MSGGCRGSGSTCPPPGRRRTWLLGTGAVLWGLWFPPRHPPLVSQSCSKGTARCIWFECPLLHTQHPTTFSIRARVWNSTFIEVSVGAVGGRGWAGLPRGRCWSRAPSLPGLSPAAGAPPLPLRHPQEYSSFDRVKVEGTATLFLRTHIPTINMRNHTVRVSDAGAAYWGRLGGTGATGSSSPNQALLGPSSSPWTWTRS